MVVLALVVGLVAVVAPVDAAPASSEPGSASSTTAPTTATTTPATATTATTATAETDPTATDGPDGPAPEIELPRPVRGATAIRMLGEQIDEAAVLNDLRVDELVDLLSDDTTAWVDTEGRVFYKDAAVEQTREGLVPAAAAPLDQTFALHSKPGAKRTIFLDFDGASVSATAWHEDSPEVTTSQPAWRPSGATSGAFNSTDLTAFQAVYDAVAEDYAAFDVDVTTADPGAAAIRFSGPGDEYYGSHVLITPDAVSNKAICGEPPTGGCGGVAYKSIFGVNYGPGGDGYGFAQPAWVFPQSAGGTVKGVVEAASHEAGHQLGLSHDGNQAGVDNYDLGHRPWAPIMGAGYYHPVTQWSKGDYANGNNHEDDVAILRDKLGLRVDEAPGVIVGAPAKPAGTAYITSRTDVDTYLLGTCSGAVSVAANPLSAMPDLDLKITLLSASGGVVASIDPPTAQPDLAKPDGVTGMAASLSQSLPSATYYVQVDGVGNGTWPDGYDDYGSLGAYTVTSSGCDGAAPTGTPTAPTSLTGTPHATASSVALAWSAPASSGASPVTGYVITRAGDDTVVQVGAGTTGYTWTGLSVSSTYTFRVTALNDRGPGPTASVTATTSNGLVKPGVPQAVSARWLSVAGAGQVSYSPPASSGTNPVVQYDVSVDGVFVVSGGSAMRTVDVVSDLLTPGTHTIGVAATSVAGPGPVATVSVVVPARPANDAFEQRTTLSGATGTLTADNLESSRQIGDPLTGDRIGAGRASLWYSWTAPESGVLSVSTTSAVADRDTSLGVYVGSALGALTTYARNDDAAGYLSAVQLRVTAGTSYAIVVDGYRTKDTGVGPFGLSWGFVDDRPKPTTTALTVGSAGTTVSLSSTVTATYGKPVGYVEYRSGEVVLGYGDVNTTTATSTITAANQPRGQHTYTARFVPDNPNAFVGSSTSQLHTVAGTPTTTSLQASVDAHSVTLTTTVTPATVDGYVQLHEGEVEVGSGFVVNGVLSVTLTSVASGEHTYAATFSPTDAQVYDGSTSSASAITVEGPPAPRSTSTSLSGQLSARTATLTATVGSASGTPAGTVQVTDGGAVVGTATLSGGTATLVVADLTRGSHTFRASFVPEDPSVYAGSQSANVTLFAQATPTATDLTTAVNGRTVTLRASVIPTAATTGGYVQFREGASLVGSVWLTDAAAQLVLAGVPTGEHAYTASFIPADPTRYDYSTSPGRTATVLALPTATALGSAVTDRRVTLVATVSAGEGTPTGAVEFREGATLLATEPVSGGTATTSLTGVTTGAHDYTATFVSAAPASYADSVSPTHTAVVSAPATTTDLSVDVAGRTVTLSAGTTATEGSPEGTVEFREGTTLLGTVPLAEGTARVELTGVAPGPHAYRATFVPSGPSHSGSSSPTRTVTVWVATTTALDATVDRRAVTLVADVAGPGNPAGRVVFRDGTTVVGTVTVSGGSARLTLPDVVPGEHGYTATFEATDPAAYGTSTSPTRTVTVDRVATTTALVASASGRSVTLTATVTAASGALSGTVELRDGGTLVASQSLSGGTATRVLSSVAFGAHSYTATFVPTGTVHSGSASQPQDVTVLGTTTTALTAGVSGRTVTLTALVSSDGTTPTGTVTFFRAGSPLTNATVVDGTAVLTLAGVVPGQYSYTARFNPSTTAHAASTSPAATATVAQVASATSLQASVADRTVTLDAAVTVESGTASGLVRFREGENLVGSVTLAGGAARLTLASATPGEHTYTATFVPNDGVTYAGSVSAERTVAAARIATTTGLSAAVSGRTVTLTATPATSAGTLTGAVELRDGDTLVGTVPLATGPVALTLSDVAPGAHTYTATFVPTGTTHAGSTSPSRTVTLAAIATATGLTTAVEGRTVTLDAQVTSGSGTPAGDVVFREGGTVLRTVALAPDGARVTLSDVTPGAHSYTATFVPEVPATYSGSASPTRTVTVAPVATSTGLVVTYDGGRTVTLEAPVAGAGGSPAGTVVFRDGETVVATGVVTAGSAPATLQGVAPGPHTYRATFVPTDAVAWAGSVSPSRSVTADPFATRTALSAAADGRTVRLEAGLDAETGGVVEFRDGSTLVGTVDVERRSAVLTLDGVTPGEHAYTATLVPADPATYAGSVSEARTVTVKVPTATTLAAAVDGRTVVLSAEVTAAGAPAGDVVFREGTDVLATVAVEDGAAALTLSDVAPGEHGYRATFVPAAADTVEGSISTLRTVTVDASTTATELGTLVDGRTVTLDVTVTAATGTPAGTVRLLEGDTLLGTVTLQDGVAALELTDVTPGTHRYVARFVPADPVGFAPSASGEREATVAPAATETILDAGGSGRTVVLDAWVGSDYGTPAGDVVLRDGAEVVGTMALDEGLASLTLTGVRPGAHDYTATFVPTRPATYAGSISPVRSHTVAAIDTQTDLSVSAKARTVLLTATVTAEGGTPAGDVVYREGDEVVGTVAVQDGTAALELTAVSPGEHAYTASFVPTDETVFGASVSPQRGVVVDPIVTTTDLAASVDVRTVRLAAEVTAESGTPAGEVVFREGADVVGTVALEDGTAVSELTGVEPGEHTYSATFVPEAAYGASSSPERRVVVAPIVTATDLSTSVDVRTVTLAAEVASDGGTPTGDVVFREGTDVVGTVALEEGRAAQVLTGVAPGRHAYTATFVPADDVRFERSVSPQRTAVVEPILTSTDLRPTADGSTVTLAVRVDAESGSPTGEVTLREGDTVLATLPLESGAVSFEITDLEPGERTYSATFAPADPATYAGSASGDRTVTVGRVATVTDLGATVDERAVDLTATVETARGTLVGEVQLLQDGSVVATRPLVDGRAHVRLNPVDPGRHTYVAVFVPEGATHAESASPERYVEVSSDPVSTVTTLRATVRHQTVTLTAEVTSSAGVPDGIVEILDGNESIGSFLLEDGTVTWDFPRVAPGIHDYTARFLTWGGAMYAESTSATRSVTVLGTPSVTTLTATAQDDTVHLSAEVAAEVEPQGVVEFYEGARLVGSQWLAEGSAGAQLTGVVGGRHTYVAVFWPSDPGMESSRSADLAVAVAATPTSTTLTSRRPSGTRRLDLTAEVSGRIGSPGGTVTFLDGLQVLGSEPVTDGVARLTLGAVSTGEHRYTATFTPADAERYAASSSGERAVLVEASATSTSFSAVPDGPTVAVEARVTSPDGEPVGRVDVTEGGQVVQSGELAAGETALTLVGVAPGEHTYEAVFVPSDTTFAASTSTPRTVTVTEAPKAVATTTTLAADVVRRTVTLTAGVSADDGSTVAGTVELAEGGSVLFRVPVRDGVAAAPLTGVPAGPHTWTATFVPDNSARLLASSSDPVSRTVAATVTSTALEATLSASTATFKVAVTGTDGLVPTGTADLYDGATLVRSLLLVDGAASVVVPGVAVGTHPYRAVFVPLAGAGGAAADFATSTSATRSLTVAPVPVASRTTVTAPKRAKAGTRPVVKVKVLRGAAAASGQVVLRYGTKTVTLTLRSGAASFKLPKLRAGKLKLTATYRANATTRTSVGTGTIVVQR